MFFLFVGLHAVGLVDWAQSSVCYPHPPYLAVYTPSFVYLFILFIYFYYFIYVFYCIQMSFNLFIFVHYLCVICYVQISKMSKKICHVICFVYYCLNIKNAKKYYCVFYLFKSKGKRGIFSLNSRYDYFCAFACSLFF